MKIYEFSAFPSPRRVRMFLAEKGINDIRYVPVDVLGGEARGEAFLSKNPLGEVPVLELDDGTFISETTAISRFFEELEPAPALFGTTPHEKAVVEMWQSRLETGLMGAISTYYHHATPGFGPMEADQNKAWGERSLDRALATMRLLDAELNGRTFIAGDGFSIADITALCAIDFAKACEIEIPSELSSLRAWYARVSSRASASA